MYIQHDVSLQQKSRFYASAFGCSKVIEVLICLQVHSVPSLGRLCITETALLNLVWMSLGLLKGLSSNEAITDNAGMLRAPPDRYDT